MISALFGVFHVAREFPGFDGGLDNFFYPIDN